MRLVIACKYTPWTKVSGGACSTAAGSLTCSLCTSQIPRPGQCPGSLPTPACVRASTIGAISRHAAAQRFNTEAATTLAVWCRWPLA